jgi:imidazolonepropionase-like amidohydrolase
MRLPVIIDVNRTLASSGVMALGLLAVAEPVDLAEQDRRALLLNPDAAEFQQAAPAVSIVRLETSKGNLDLEVTRSWCPRGADRFVALVRAGYYDGARFFRIRPGYWAQVGVNGDPAVAAAWRTRTFPDDPFVQSNVGGTVAFAFAVPNGRTTQIFINLRDNSATHDKEPFVPFARVVRGMDIARALNAEHGEGPGGIRAGKQDPFFAGGNAWLDREFPRLDYINRAVVMPTSSAPKTIVVRFGRLWDGDRLVRDASVVIEGDRIQRVATGRNAPPAGTETVDLSGYTGLPGLIDAHTHMTYYWDGAPGTRPLGQPRRAPELTVQLAGENARRTLEAGVTTVRDLGASGGTDVSLRDLINSGRMTGPRMFVSGQGISAGRGGAPDRDAWRQLTEARLQTSADWVKVYASRGSFQSVDTTQTIQFDGLKTIVETAHARGRKVAIHSYGPSGVRDAVRAGADSVEHGIDLDDETLAEMAKRGTVWVPTIDHNRYYVEAKDEYGFAPEAIPPLQAYIEKNLASARRAVRAGVTLAMGSDAVYSMFGQNTRELGWLVRAGMTPEQALRSATRTGAELVGQADRLGRVAAGFLADLVAVDGNPVERIDTLFTGVRWVMKGGVVVADTRR